MKLIKSGSLLVAEEVLYELGEILKANKKNGTVYVETYSNGREQGYYVSNFDKGVAASFSEYRSTDQIVAYCGNTTDFSRDGMPNEKVYNGKEMFDYGEYKKAAKFIANHLA